MTQSRTVEDVQLLQSAKDLEEHIRWLDTFTPSALAVMAGASGIYTYLGVTSLLDGTGALTILAALCYSAAVSVGIFVFWSYILRLLPSMRSVQGLFGLSIATVVGSFAVIAMSSWLNAAALAGAAAVEQHLAKTVQNYQSSLEQAHLIAISAQGLEAEIERASKKFSDLATQENEGNLSGTPGRGAVFRILTQKSDELIQLRDIIVKEKDNIQIQFDEGNKILSQMRSIIADTGPVEQRSVTFSEESVKLSGVITKLRQSSVAPLVKRAAIDLRESIIQPELDGRTQLVQKDQASTIKAVLEALKIRAKTLEEAAQEILDMEPPEDTTYMSLSAADAVIKYAKNFYPSWAGAIAIDLLPGVLVFILAVTKSAIRTGRRKSTVEDRITLADLKVAMSALREVETNLAGADESIETRKKTKSKPSLANLVA